MQGDLTSFGQFVRKLRISKHEYLKDMAEKLSITPAYLSAVEHGRRNVPFSWILLLQTHYDIEQNEIEKLIESVIDSRYYDRLDISHLSIEQKVLLGKITIGIEQLNETQLISLEKWFDVECHIQV